VARRDRIIKQAARLHQTLAAAARSALPVGDGITPERAEELIEMIRAGRDSR
jgi:hypothetical protein